MMTDKLLEIKKYPDKVLRQNCVRVDKITDEEKTLFENMLFTMRHFCGIGLAAPQIGISKRLIVASVGDVTLKLANPEIVNTSGSDIMTEGCLSIPNAEVKVKRPFIATVKGMNEKGKIVELKTNGLLAKVLQHEIDHLKGRLIIDYMNILKRFTFMLTNKRQKING